MLRGAMAMAAPNVRSTFQAGKGKNPPLVVLVHGLESFSGTWDGVRERCSSSSQLSDRSPSLLTLDLRGHGRSPIGDEDTFSPAALAADVVACAREHLQGDATRTTFTLVGHSMGSRIALRAAADFPDAIDHVVVEDMDCKMRTPPHAFDHDALRQCELTGASADEVKDALMRAMPDVMTAERCDGYIERGRIVEGEFILLLVWAIRLRHRVYFTETDQDTGVKRWTSLINPLGYALAYERVLAVDDAALAIKQIERFAAMRKPAPIVHLWRAPFDEQTTCAAKDGLGKFLLILVRAIRMTSLCFIVFYCVLLCFNSRRTTGNWTDVVVFYSGGVEWILRRDGSSEWRIRDCVFQGAGHSVHNTRAEAFTDAMVALAFDGVDAPESL